MPSKKEDFSLLAEGSVKMYELIQIKGGSFYLQSPAKIGLVKLGGDEVCLIDSGSDKDAGRRVRQLLDKNGWRLTAIYNTHSHADHTGGNKYLQDRTGCRIFAPGIEYDFTNHPVLEPSFLYGGYPPSELRHKFLLAQESRAEELTEDALPDGMATIPLPGHYFDMVGYRTADNVVYLADCLSSRETLEKYRISFIYDVAAYIDTLEKIKSLKADMFVPSHAAPTDDIAPLADINLAAVSETAERITDICRTPIGFEEILQRLFCEYSLRMDFEQYALVGSTVRSYLAWLRDSGRIEPLFEDGRLLWKA